MSGQKNKITLIDDEKELVSTLKEFLELKGFEVSTAYDGEEGYATIKSCLPDIILLDIMMPKLDGRDLLIRLKNEDDTKNIPVIILSAKDEEFDIEYGRDLGAVSYMTKPYSIRTVMKTVTTLLGS